VGITGSRNGTTWAAVLREAYADTRDIRQRVLFDPTAELVGGLSGGGETAYVFSRFHAQHTAGVLAMGAWLGRVTYYSTDRVQSNLLVARTTGTTDVGANWFLGSDGNYLASCGAAVKDWTFTGGHTVPSDATKTDCLAWLLRARIPAGPTDHDCAQVQADIWYTRLSRGETEAVVRECFAAVMSYPRSWMALYAQRVLDQVMAAYPSIRTVPVAQVAEGDFASDFAYYYAFGAAMCNDLPRYYASLKLLTGISGTCGDRAGDIYALLQQWGYPAPLLQIMPNAASDQVTLGLSKDASGITYTVQARSNLVSGAWQDLTVTAFDTNTSHPEPSIASLNHTAPANSHPSRTFAALAGKNIPVAFP
jgi:hypothetical protein